MNIDKLRGWFGFQIRFITLEKGDAISFKPKEDVEWLLPDKPKSKVKLEWKKYWHHVWRLTNEIADQIPGIEKRGFKDHHIDHIIPVWKGYKKGIPATEIASLKNLRMLPYKENIKKGRT